MITVVQQFKVSIPNVLPDSDIWQFAEDSQSSWLWLCCWASADNCHLLRQRYGELWTIQNCLLGLILLFTVDCQSIIILPATISIINLPASHWNLRPIFPLSTSQVTSYSPLWWYSWYSSLDLWFLNWAISYQRNTVGRSWIYSSTQVCLSLSYWSLYKLPSVWAMSGQQNCCWWQGECQGSQNTGDCLCHHEKCHSDGSLSRCHQSPRHPHLL